MTAASWLTFPAFAALIWAVISFAYAIIVSGANNHRRHREETQNEIDRISHQFAQMTDHAKKVAQRDLKQRAQASDVFHAMEACPKCETIAIHPFHKETVRWVGIGQWQAGVIRQCANDKCKFTWKQY